MRKASEHRKWEKDVINLEVTENRAHIGVGTCNAGTILKIRTKGWTTNTQDVKCLKPYDDWNHNSYMKNPCLLLKFKCIVQYTDDIQRAQSAVWCWCTSNRVCNLYGTCKWIYRHSGNKINFCVVHGPPSQTTFVVNVHI